MREISLVTIIFGLSALTIGWLSLFSDLVGMIQLRQIAIVLLVLFFHSLNNEEINELNDKIQTFENNCKCGSD